MLVAAQHAAGRAERKHGGQVRVAVEGTTQAVQQLQAAGTPAARAQLVAAQLAYLGVVATAVALGVASLGLLVASTATEGWERSWPFAVPFAGLGVFVMLIARRIAKRL